MGSSFIIAKKKDRRAKAKAGKSLVNCIVLYFIFICILLLYFPWIKLQIQHLSLSASHRSLALEITDFDIMKYILGFQFNISHSFPTFDILHARHTCVHREADGLLVPNTTAIREAFNKKPRGYVFLNSGGYDQPLRPVSHQRSKQNETVTYFPGDTYLVNCWRQKISRTNPTHWLMKLGALFEISTIMPGNLSALTALVFHQCPNPFASSWKWGELLWAISSRSWSHLPTIWLGDFRTDYACFDSLYFDARYSSWFSSSEIFKSWRQVASVILKDASFIIADANTRTSCGPWRLKIYQRSSGNALRNFDNLEEVKALAQSLTAEPVEVFTTNENSALLSQIASFRDFDILITPHGSHIANMIFSPLRIVVIEVISVVRDPAFQRNARDMGFFDYVISTGHRVSPDCPAADVFGKKCTMKDDDIVCEKSVVPSVTQCNVVVNIKKLKEVLEDKLLELGQC